MKKRVGLITIVAVMSLIGGGILLFNFFNGSQEQLEQTETMVYDYLTEERNYTDEEIDSIRTEYNWRNDRDDERGAYQAYVTFSDEADYEYEYIYNDLDGVIQIGRNEGEGNHTE
ncbi:DUF3139 domain-containing protein [Alkalicoccobacillus plakortidis]|uniref:DUF3139 domain-containing protein n=1 Tax=Alkalicoccobacillus plakortidis TaxID=444060 RepID=A0ABT0XPU0_9BACI|nr:DUF3139 domain-containing protein [Alkalicoccobacillus plakortidis]MCM2677926.1 DUF3139 domain-containing protein [Alkalicoccobacillus plakortidis]